MRDLITEFETGTLLVLLERVSLWVTNDINDSERIGHLFAGDPVILVEYESDDEMIVENLVKVMSKLGMGWIDGDVEVTQ